MRVAFVMTVAERTHTLPIRPRVAAVRAESRMFTPDSRQVRRARESHQIRTGSRQVREGPKIFRLRRGETRT